MQCMLPASSRMSGSLIGSNVELISFGHHRLQSSLELCYHLLDAISHSSSLSSSPSASSSLFGDFLSSFGSCVSDVRLVLSHLRSRGDAPVVANTSNDVTSMSAAVSVEERIEA